LELLRHIRSRADQGTSTGPQGRQRDDRPLRLAGSRDRAPLQRPDEARRRRPRGRLKLGSRLRLNHPSRARPRMIFRLSAQHLGRLDRPRGELNLPQPETVQNLGEHNQTTIAIRTYRANVVNVIISAATLLAIIAYAYITYKLLQAETRPYVAALCKTDFGQENANLHYRANESLRMGVTLLNFGKLPADASIWSFLKYSATPLDRAEPFPDRPEHMTVWPNIVGHAEGAKSQTLSIEDADAIRRKSGFVYFAVKVRYSRHETLVCKEYTLSEAMNVTEDEVPLPVPRLCRDPQSNHAD